MAVRIFQLLICSTLNFFGILPPPVCLVRLLGRGALLDHSDGPFVLEQEVSFNQISFVVSYTPLSVKRVHFSSGNFVEKSVRIFLQKEVGDERRMLKIRNRNFMTNNSIFRHAILKTCLRNVWKNFEEQVKM